MKKVFKVLMDSPQQKYIICDVGHIEGGCKKVE